VKIQVQRWLSEGGDRRRQLVSLVMGVVGTAALFSATLLLYSQLLFPMFLRSSEHRHDGFLPAMLALDALFMLIAARRWKSRSRTASHRI
jgi:hypothetical protein